MTNEFDKQRHRKAFIYTASICCLLLLAFIFISWKVVPPAPPIIPLQMEINLGNNEEGFGQEEPLAKGEPAPTETEPTAIPTPPQEESATTQEVNVTPDDNAEEAAAPVTKAVIKSTPIKNINPTPKPVLKTVTASPAATKITQAAKPKFTMPNAKGPGGNNANIDNGFDRQGNKIGGRGNNGVLNGNPDTYGTKPGGSISGASVTKGNRRIISVRPYKFPGDLERATIFADIRVSPSGVGTFLRFSIGSTSTATTYASAIRGYLPNIKFDGGDDDGIITVRFNFNAD